MEEAASLSVTQSQPQGPCGCPLALTSRVKSSLPDTLRSGPSGHVLPPRALADTECECHIAECGTEEESHSEYLANAEFSFHYIFMYFITYC